MRLSPFALLLFAAPSSALAYSDTGSFAVDPSSNTAGGGGGIYFTGSPRQHGLDCAACHIEAPSGTALRLSALLDGRESSLFARGYEPGQIYEIEVAFDGTNLAPANGCGERPHEPCDLNLFALEIDDTSGVSAGALCPIKPDAGPPDHCARCGSLRAAGTRVEAGCDVLLADGFDEVAMTWRNGVRAYSFFWAAPATDIGPVVLYVSAVDGAGLDPDGEVTSYVNDGVVSLAVPLRSPSRAFEEPSSCRAFSARSGLEVLLLGALAFVLGRRRAATKKSESSGEQARRA